MPTKDQVQATLHRFTDQNGEHLRTLNEQQPLLLALLRHTGCPFCVESVHDLAAAQDDIAAKGVAIAVVFQTPDRDGPQRMIEQQGLRNAHIVPDPDRELYRLFGIREGNAWQVFGPGVLLSIFRVIGKGLRPGKKVGGSIMQLPGTVLVHNGEVLRSHVHRSQADRANYRAICAMSAGAAGRPAAG